MDKFLGVLGNHKGSDSNDSSAEQNDPKRKCANSNVWNHFKRLESGSVVCLICGHVYITGGNTTNLFNHLKRAHPTVCIPKAVRTLGEFFDNAKPKKYESSSTRKTLLDKALISMIATDLQPFRIVQDHCLDPQHALPCRKTLNDVLLTNMHENMENMLKNILSKIRHCAVTTDGWTSRANDQDQTSQNIACFLHKILFEWGVESKVSAIVTDNAASMIKACVILQKIHLPCFAHTLNLIMQDTLKNIKPIIAKCKRTFFKSSSIAYLKLKSAQENDTSYGLIQEVPIRWNSCYKMVGSILKIKDAVSRVLLDTKKTPPLHCGLNDHFLWH